MQNTPRAIDKIATGVVAALCVVTILLVLMVPAGSLVIDLVYQGF